MALGDGGNKQNYQNGDNKYTPTVYSPVSFKNSENFKIEGSELSFKFWKRLLCIQISPMNERKPGDAYATFDHKNNISIFLTHVKARLLYKAILAMLKDDSIPDVSVNSGATGLITFSNGKEFGVDHYMMIIRNVNPDEGTVVESYSYEITGSGYNYITNYNEQTGEHNRVLYETLEIECILDVLEQFIKSVNYATAYSVVDSLQYDFARVNNGVDLLLENSGLSRKQNKTNGNARAKSFFDGVNNGNRKEENPDKGRTKTTSLDELASGFETFDNDGDLPF